MASERGPPPWYPFSLSLPALLPAAFPLTANLESPATETCCLTLRPELHAPQEVMKVRGLFQLCVFRLGLLQDGNIRVGVFPEREEILVGGAGFGAGVLL